MTEATVQIDPNDMHDIPHEHIVEMCGLIPIWMKALHEATEGRTEKYDIRVALDKLYKHGGGWIPALPGEWNLNDDLVLRYTPSEEDPAYEPLMVWTFGNGQVAAMYLCQWVVVRTPELGFEVVRMD